MTEQEINNLARELADESVVNLIESMTHSEMVDNELWHNLDSPFFEDSVAVSFERDIRFAEARGLLRHHPTQNNLVQIVEVPE